LLEEHVELDRYLSLGDIELGERELELVTMKKKREEV
jgi:hypothetical protein